MHTREAAASRHAPAAVTAATRGSRSRDGSSEGDILQNDLPEPGLVSEAFHGIQNLNTREAPFGVVVRRVPDAAAYAEAEPGLIEQLLEVRARLIEADLGKGIATASWGADYRI